MATHLVTFLGRAPAGAAGGLADEPALRYRFPDGWVSPPARLPVRAALGWADVRGPRPDRLLVLGTGASMWDALLTDLVDGCDAADLWAEIHEAAAAERVTQAQVDRVAAAVAPRLGRAIRGRVVPAGASEAEQLALLDALADGIAAKDRLLLDLTHRYRHLPLMGLMAASLLAYDRGCTIADVWYADARAVAGDPPAAPIVPLRALLRVQAWARAFAVLRESGRAGPLAALLGEHPAAAPLADTGFYLATNQVTEARRSGARAATALRRDPSDDPLLAVVRDDLLDDLAWVDAPHVWSRMLDIARQSLAAGDHLAAVTLAIEACYWAAAEGFWGKPKPVEPEAIEALRRAVDDELAARPADRARFHLLRRLRNAAAHGRQPEGRGADDVRRALSDAATYTRVVGDCIEWVGRAARTWVRKR